MFGCLPQHRVLSVMPTYQCTAACTHCGTYSNPRNQTRLDFTLVATAIDQAIENGYKVVVFTGGEPTLAGSELLAGIRRAAAGGLGTRLVTNAWWANGAITAKETIAELVRAGLHEINFSTGDQHARFVPLENVLWACRAALEAGFKPICVMIELVRERTITQQLIMERADYRDLRETFGDDAIRLMESPWMPPSPVRLNDYPAGTATNRKNIAARGGCDSCLSTTTIQADGRIAACCGLGMRSIPELQLGNIRTTKLADADKNASDDFLKRWIRLEGPERILAWAASHDDRIGWENMYAHKCQACIRLYKDPMVRRVISEHHQEKILDVLLGEWLVYHYETDAGSNKAANHDLTY